MKKLLLFMFAVVTFAACEQAPIEEAQGVVMSDRSLEVSFEGADDTRIQLQGGKTVWTEGDYISVFYRSSVNEEWQFMGETGDRTGQIVPVDNSVNPPATHNRVVVIYPYNNEYYLNTETYSIEASLPAVQNYLEDSYGTNGNIMVSSGDYKQVSLKSVCGWLKLQLTGDGEVVKSITLRGNNGEQVAGELYINTSDATSVLASASGDAGESEVGGTLVRPGTILTEVTLDCGEGVALGKEATAFYIALPPQAFEQGLTVDVNCKGYNPMSITTQKVVAIERNHIQPMAEVAFSSDVRTIANNEIWYVAPQKIDRSNSTWTYDTFGANVVSNEWDSLSGEGIITFDGEVTKIGDKAFQSANITSITLSDSVILIGAHAFEWCQSLSSIQIPANVERIGMLAFYNSAISEITFKTSKLTTIEDGAFLNCAELIEINLPTSITHIGGSVFRGCTKLEGIHMGYTNAYMSVGLGGPTLIFHDYEKNITTIVAYPAGAVTQKVSSYVHPHVNIAWGAFWDCDHIVEVWLSFIRSIEQMNFCYCDNLEYINLDEVEYIANDVLSYCSNLKGLSLPRVESIGSHTFCDNESLEYISLNSEYLEEVNTIANDNISLTTINLGTRVSSIINSFNGCAAITEVYCKATTPPALTDSFDSVVAPTIYVPADSVNVYKSAEGWKEFAIVGYDFENGEIVEMQPNNEIWYTSSDGNIVEPYNTNAFGANIISNEYNNGKGVITFDGNVTTIGTEAFAFCHSLTSVNIGDSVTAIGTEAFAFCHSLTSVNIGDSVTAIGTEAFAFCHSLTSVNIPDSVTTIGEGAFRGCKILTEFTGKFAEDNGRILVVDGVLTAFAPAGITEYNIPDSVTEIGDYAFGWCSSLTSVNIPDSVTTIGDGAFAQCASLTSVTIGDSVTTLGKDAFQGCKSLIEFKGKFATEDGRSLIMDNTIIAYAKASGTTYTIPDGVTTIGEGVFADCYSLTSVTIPDSVTSIGERAFYNSYNLTSVNIPDSVTTIGNEAFCICARLTSVTIPDSVTTIGNSAFYYCTSLKSVYCKATTPPALGRGDVFYSNGSGRKIYVPTESVDAYKSATNWSEYAYAIVGYDF